MYSYKVVCGECGENLLQRTAVNRNRQVKRPTDHSFQRLNRQGPAGQSNEQTKQSGQENKKQTEHQDGR